MPLLDLLHQFNASDYDCRPLKALQIEQSASVVLHSPLVLLDHVVAILARSHLHPLRQLAAILQERKALA